MAEGALILLFLFIGLAATIGLYALIDAETSNPTVVDRADAEREARARGGRSETDPVTGGVDEPESDRFDR